MTQTPPNFPLRWESIGDQWWYAAPIDWAAANGLYDLVRELLHLDTNLLIKLTSLRRIRRLESVWDDHHPRLACASANRARVARRLLAACEPAPGQAPARNSLIRAGYGGWLLYTAAAAGDAAFAAELLGRDPALAYGEGEYGITDLLYAAARGGSAEVFRMLVGSALALAKEGGGEELRWEVANRAAHAAARGGNVAALKEVFEENGGENWEGVSSFRDDQGSTLLHSAAGRGQVQVVKYLIETYDNNIITITDNQGNTALHVAAHRGFSTVVETLIHASPSVAAARNNYGDTFLHAAVAGFRAPGFRRLDKLIALVKSLVSGEFLDLGDLVNARNSDGRTALHAAVAENADIGLVELLMSAPGINLNVRDFDGMTPLDLLKRRPRSASSEILIKQLISAGGISNRRDHRARIVKTLASQLKSHIGTTSPGTSFRIPDAEIFLFTGIDSNNNNNASEIGTFSDNFTHNNKKKSVSVDFAAAKRLNFFLKRWPKRKEDKKKKSFGDIYDHDDGDSTRHVPLRQRFSTALIPSPSAKMKFAAGLTHGVIKTAPAYLAGGGDNSPASTSAFSGSSSGGESSPDKEVIRRVGGGGKKKACGSSKRGESLDEKLMMNEYFCFGAQEGVGVEDSMSCNGNKHHHHHSFI